ncbi:unnamed protein product [Clonostachys byssicola]|uniref:AMP-dependent synthetase/ligase domain-containing protein n=1 Tax=Clonostachys byssicola TaxID=160290 RepID=A0A9N9Y0N5_9HYPO|nr:unnamed protein product [Clonostachys byssicola]
MDSNTEHSPDVLWKPLPSSGFHIKNLIRMANEKHGAAVTDYESLWAWSTNASTAPTFWMEIFEYLGIKTSKGPHAAMQPHPKGSDWMYPPVKFFPGAKMNFAENMFANYQAEETAMHIVSEGADHIRNVTWRELRDDVAKVAGAMVASGVKEGDRIAAVISNRLETIVICLAALSIGAIWSSSSPDMGVDGVLSRLTQIRPKLVFCESEVTYNAKLRDLLPSHCQWTKVLSKDSQLTKVVVISGEREILTEEYHKMTTWDRFLDQDTGRPLTFKQLPFDHPAFIVYSSGTSGPPKCIVHSAGGLLLQVRKDCFFSYDVRKGDTFLQYTTTGWIMWAMVLVSLSFGGRVVIYDGSPFVPDSLVLLRLVERLRINVLGTSAKFLSMLMDSGVKPRDVIDLSSLRTITSTGSTLTAKVARWFYTEGFPQSIHLVSTCGGTDLACSLISGAATQPLHAGEIQAAALGMAVDIFDVDNEAGVSIRTSDTPGELVCTRPFPSQPVSFWGDNTGEKYKNSYFSRFGERVWAQGDFISRNPSTGGYLTHGRSDGVLNPAGVRFGSAEIYNVIDSDKEIMDSLCVGQRRQNDSDETVVLFVQMYPAYKFTSSVVTRLREAVRSKLSPRHVPRYIFEVPDIPHTINGKKIEILVKKIISGQNPQVSSTVANPECLEFYKQFVHIEQVDAQQQQKWNISRL